MRLTQAFPAGPDVTPEDRYTGLELSDRARDDRPYVVCNFVSSADGKATAAGRAAPLANAADRAVFHLLRTQVDALLAGTQTMRAERYGSPIREPCLSDIRLAEGRNRQPLAVVISRSGDVPFEIPLFADAAVQVIVYVPAAAIVPACSAGVVRHEIPTGDGDLVSVMRSLRRDHGVRSLLCEGGPRLFNALLAQGLVDELFLTLAPALVGGGELGITLGPAPPAMQPMRLVWALESAGSLFLRYRRPPD
jgi:riboflavin biosynthesis pyrimidine reductase